MAKSSDSVERPLSLSPSPASNFRPAFSSSSSSSSSTAFSSSPMRMRLRHSSPPPPKSMCLSLDRSLSHSQSDPVRDQASSLKRKTLSKNPKKTCMCSPTTHPGSFRCHYHRNLSNETQNHPISSSPSRLTLRRSAMTNSLLKIGTVEFDWVKRALSALVRPTLHQHPRRVDFRPRPSRLSFMSTPQL